MDVFNYLYFDIGIALKNEEITPKS